jgi:hypothetical protein
MNDMAERLISRYQLPARAAVGGGARGMGSQSRLL